MVNTDMDIRIEPTRNFQQLAPGRAFSINIHVFPRHNAARNVRLATAIMVVDGPESADQASRVWTEFIASVRSNIDTEAHGVNRAEDQGIFESPHALLNDHTFYNVTHHQARIYALLAMKWENVSGSEGKSAHCAVLVEDPDLSVGVIDLSSRWRTCLVDSKW